MFKGTNRIDGIAFSDLSPAMSTEEKEEVEVLYDYSYSDDHGPVDIREGEIYRLLQKTNTEWWHVCSLDETLPDTEEDGFYVPAQYVRVLEKKTSAEQDVDSAISSLDGVLADEEEEQNYENTSVLLSAVQHGRNQLESQRNFLAPAPPLPPPPVNGVRANTEFGEESEYVNLDQFRADAKIPSLDTQTRFSADTAKESDYANLPFQLEQQQQQQQQHQQQHAHSSEQGPHLQDGHFVRVLLEGLPWDIYEDKSKRKFFHNRETGELTWKPPRKDKPSSPVGTGLAISSLQQSPRFPGPTQRVCLAPAVDQEQEEYTKTETGGDVFYINNSTNEKWQQLSDEMGRSYFHRLGSNDTLWALPTVPRSMSESQGGASPRAGEEGAASNFTVRPMSMYGKIEHVQPSASDPKAFTLPPNFSPNSQEQLSGYLNRTKIELGKKKVKKNWTQTFLVLQGSNLIFYKDQKAAAQKPGSPHGKPEHVISLQGAKVDFNPSKEITSRRNTILLSVQSGSQIFLLHSDDEKTIHEWLLRLKMGANDIVQESSPREHGQRSVSESGTETGNRNMVGIKAKLLSFLNRRPAQEDLIKQGIIKDLVFGSHLQSICDRDKSSVPNFVLECITAVENKGLEHDGLYRISGNLAEIQKLRYVIDKDDCHNLADEQWDIHTLTGALKLFFRELKEPLFPFKCVDKFLNAVKKEPRKEKTKCFKDALSSLPKCNYETMRVLFQHLKNVVHFSAENRMQTQNVAIVFGPTLMWMEEGDFNNMAVLTVYQSKVVEFLLLEYDHLFR